MRRTWAIPVALLFLFGCQSPDYLYYSPVNGSAQFDSSYRIKELQGSTDVDIIWVIDNSASMANHQQNVIDNTQVFMDQFTQLSYLKWKMALISTDSSDSPYVGMGGAAPLDYQTSAPVNLFQRAVERLGIQGAGTEMTYDPLMRALKDDPTFLRPDAILAVIMVTDAAEQSDQADPPLSTSDIVDFLRTAKGGDLRKIVTYGVLGPQDWGCPATDDYWEYRGSRYEEFIQATSGKTYLLCSPTFGTDLVALAKDLVARVQKPKIFLDARPVPGTIRVSFHGKVLPGGPQAEGGYWFYDYDQNALVFYDLSFAPGDQEQVEVQYTKVSG